MVMQHKCNYSNRFSAVLAECRTGGGDEQKPHQNLSTGTYKSSAGSLEQFSAERPSNQSSTYTEKISSAIAEKAISAKNVVATKLGYGGNNAAKPGGSTAPERGRCRDFPTCG
ncbi:PREDICTED: low-temperature-induced [Prunus dulcis]|uniref:PREDICTED: low-temperature-induced n=1 Tax=Prunus dulcis TaxID=3755 RepID=A0A5E4EVR6_PRUDU|nr:PREDICTED: low-temperature-induced [Prunus dulcis]